MKDAAIGFTFRCGSYQCFASWHP